MSKSEQQPTSTELILNSDGSVYHLKLRPEQLADTILLVGDQDRVRAISQYFDDILFEIKNREFITHTGILNGLKISVLSTGIGTENIDIVMNELDAVVNFDLSQRKPKLQRKSLNIVRVGTSGGIQPEVKVGSFVVSEFAVGFDGIVYYYDYPFNAEEEELTSELRRHIAIAPGMSLPYVTQGSGPLIDRLGGRDMIRGFTATASGFYGPQGRYIYLDSGGMNLNEQLASFRHGDRKITNFEMESSVLYGLGNLLNHNCCTCCAIIANRATEEFSENHTDIVDELITLVLERLTSR